MNQQLLFFFSALGAFNGLIVSLYFLFFSKPKHISNIFLGGLFLALSIRVGKSVFFYFYDSIADAYIQFGLFACWLIGPFLYFYIVSAINQNKTTKKRAVITISLLAIIALVIIMFYSWSDYPKLWTIFIRIIYLQWLLFVCFSGIVIYNHKDKVFTHSKNKPFKVWLSSIYVGNLIICLAFNTGNYTSYIVGALSFSIVFYLLILLLLFYKKREQLLFLKTKKYQSNKISSSEVQDIRERLERLMEKEKMYLNANLTITKLANTLHISKVKLSQTFNEHLDISFNDYLNTFRIDAAKKIIGSKSTHTLEAIGLDCGFNSKSTFYAAFKKHTGMTPAKFRSKNTPS